MGRQFFSWLLYEQMKWSAQVSVDIPQKCIIAVAPHTSNWDFVIGQLFMRAEGLHIGFLMKKEWFFWPLGYIFRKMGGIPVYRDGRHSLTETLAETARQSKKFRLCITPEGTRRLNRDWKKGFYYIAKNAEIPILLFGIDFERKLIECTKLFVPTGNVEADMEEIKQYFKDYKGKYPEQFAI